MARPETSDHRPRSGRRPSHLRLVRGDPGPVHLMEPARKTTAPGELVRGIEAGDRRAEEALVAAYGEGVLFLLRRWTRDGGAAEDLYQETFRLALEKIRAGEVREPDRLAGFLRSLAKNLSLYHYRRGGVRAGREAALEAVAEPPDPEPGQLARLLRDERADAVRRLLSELGARDREILARFYLDEEDREAIERDLGLSRPNFNVVLCRARQRVRHLIEQRAPWRGAGE